MDLPLADAQHATLALAATLGFELSNVLLQLVQVMNAVVADADGSHFSGLHGLDKLGLRVSPAALLLPTVVC